MIPESTLNALTVGPNHIKEGENGNVVAEGYGVELYRLVALRHALSFEICTGVKAYRGSVLRVANSALGTNYRRKKQALDHIDSLLSIANM